LDSHSVSWFSYVPGYTDLRDYFLNGQIWGTPDYPEMIAQHIYGAIFVILFLALGAFATRRTFKNGPVPANRFGLSAVFDTLLGVAAGLCRDIIGDEWKRYFPLIATLGLFILFSNLIGLVPGFVPPTDNLDTTMVCGVIVFLYYNYHGLRKNGMHHITHMANPVGETWGWILAPLLFPIELVSHLARPLSLALRLRGNMVGDHAVLVIFSGMLPLFLPMPFLVMGTLVCVIQAFVFCVLSCVYISLAVAHDDHGDEAEAH